MIIYPPYIEGTIPAFTADGGLKVPFSMNPAVVESQVKGFYVQVKDLKGHLVCSGFAAAAQPIFEARAVTFNNFTFESFAIGQYYKVQLAYCDSSKEPTDDQLVNLVYSTVGITKYTTSPIVYVEGLNDGNLNINAKKENYKGIHISDDLSEPEYEYSFDIKDNEGNLFASSGWELHDANKDYVATLELFDRGLDGLKYSNGNVIIAEERVFYEQVPIIKLTTNSEDANITQPQWMLTYYISTETIQKYPSHQLRVKFKGRTEKADSNDIIMNVRTYGHKADGNETTIDSKTVQLNNTWTNFDITITYKKENGDIADRILFVLPFTTQDGQNVWEKYADRDYYLGDFHCLLADENGNEILLYNNNYDEFSCNKELVEDVPYTLTYQTRTVNGLVTSSAAYNLRNLPLIEAPFQGEFEQILNYDEGYIHVKLNKPTEVDSVSGYFVFYRASSKDNYSSWDEITRFSLGAIQDETVFEWIDKTVEHGVSYKYAYCQYNSNGVYSDKVISDAITEVDFEDMFLSDAERSLKIKFNPKVSSFKNDILEQKTDTIGGKYPFFFRNGTVKYKEFPISGLISYYQDEAETFMNKSELGLTTESALRKTTAAQDTASRVPTINLVGYNIAAEREFKLQVLDWLTNGKPKLFRSPAEGNYIVRLMNTSLSPDDKLSRMIHTFSSTAYEIAECSYDNMRALGVVDTTEMVDPIYTIATKLLYEAGNNVEEGADWEQVIDNVLAFQAEGLKPGDKIRFGEEEIVIGSTGTYSSPSTGLAAAAISVWTGNSGMGQINYKQELLLDSNFDAVSNIRYEARLRTIGPDINHNRSIDLMQYHAKLVTLLDSKNEEIIEIYQLTFKHFLQPGDKEAAGYPEAYCTVDVDDGKFDMRATNPLTLFKIKPNKIISNIRTAATAYYLVKIIE